MQQACTFHMFKTTGFKLYSPHEMGLYGKAGTGNNWLMHEMETKNRNYSAGMSLHNPVGDHDSVHVSSGFALVSEWVSCHD